MLGDVVAINMAFMLSYWLRFNSGLFRIIYGVPHISQYFKVLPVLTVVLVFLMRSDKLYSIKARLSIVDEIFTITRTVTVGVLIFMAGTFLYREFSFSRGMLFVSWFVLIFCISGWRLLVNRIRFTSRKRRGRTRNLLIIGDGPMVSRLVRHVSGDPHWDYNIKGVIRAVSADTGDIEGVPVIGNLDNLTHAIDANDIDEVILTEAEMPRFKIMHVIFECEKRMVEFRLVADLLGMVASQVDMRTIDGVPLLGLKESPLAEGYNRLIKKIMDLILSAAGLICFCPVFVVIAVLVKISSPGPVFYYQKRIGEDGRSFTMLKFRTMANTAAKGASRFRTMLGGAERGVGRVWAKKDDPRRTNVGAVLRSFNLDELPQLINVLKGEMSLVGPRPERPHFVGKFKEDIPRYMARHKIRSGMTGWAQVNGLRGNTSIEERTKYDLYYIENWSLGFDLKILFMSLFALKNAY